MKYLPCSESFPPQGVSYKKNKQTNKQKQNELLFKRVRSRWLDIAVGQVLFCVMDREVAEARSISMQVKQANENNKKNKTKKKQNETNIQSSKPKKFGQ